MRVEKYSEEKMVRLRYSSESATTTTDRLAGAMLCYMCDDRERERAEAAAARSRANGPRPLITRERLREAKKKKAGEAV